MAIEFGTGRAVYRMEPAGAVEVNPQDVTLTVKLERADGIERVVFRCRVGRAMLSDSDQADAEKVLERIAPRVQRDFEQIREAALKSVRSERKLLEIAFEA